MALSLLTDLSPIGHYLHGFVVYDLPGFVVAGLDAHELVALLQHLRERDLPVVDRRRDGAGIHLGEDLAVCEVERDGGADQMSVDILCFCGGDGGVGEVLAAGLVGSRTDQRSKGYLCVLHVQHPILHESLISSLRLLHLILDITEGSLDRQQGIIILWTLDLHIGTAPILRLDLQRSNQLLFTHLLLIRKLFVHEIVIGGGIADTEGALIAFFELDVEVGLEGHVDDQVDVLSLLELDGELEVVRQVDDLFVVYADGDHL